MKINDTNLLREIVKLTDLKDSRATWIGSAEYPQTDVQDNFFQNICRWQLQHWMMYEGFLSFINKPSGKIIDVGCGGGYPTARLNYLYPNFEVQGIDLVQEAIQFAQKHNNVNNDIKFNVQDVLTLAEDTKYDYVFALEIMEHLHAEDHYKFIDKLLSICNGLIFLSTPNSLDCQDNSFGHKGILNTERAKLFYEKYKHRIIHLSFYDNEYLHTKDHSAFTVNEGFESYTDKTRNKSHFKIVLS